MYRVQVEKETQTNRCLLSAYLFYVLDHCHGRLRKEIFIIYLINQHVAVSKNFYQDFVFVLDVYIDVHMFISCVY